MISPVRPLLCMHLITAAQADDGYHGLTVQTTLPQVIYNLRDVTAGATGATAVAPKFSDALTLFQQGGADSALPLQRSHQKFPHGYISVLHENTVKFLG